MTDSSNVTDRELLIRIDERLKSVERQITSIQSTSIPPSEHATLLLTVKDHDTRINILESFKLRVGFYITIAGAVGGLAVAILGTLITDSIRQLIGGR